MKLTRILLLTALAALLMGVAYFAMKQSAVPPHQPTETPEPISRTGDLLDETKDESMNAGSGGSVLPGGESIEEEAESLVTPEPSIVQSQGGENPHVTPAVLLEFAHQLAGLMEKALESEAAAQPVFARLEKCAADVSGKEVLQVRLVCMANAKTLAEQYPDSFEKRFESLAEKNPGIFSTLQKTGL